jgi:riboflavin kinase/FMN adenylyltransferase
VIIIRSWRELGSRFPRPVVALGKFDGVHRGHQKLLAEVRQLARKRGAPSMAVTFDAHPNRTLRPSKVPPVLATQEERIEYIESAGIDALLLIRFTKAFAGIPAMTFARDYLAGRIDASLILAGSNFRFGRNRTGDVAKLERWGNRLGFEFRPVSQVMVDGEPVSSTRVRRVIAEGDIRQATRLLGRHYSVDGIVVHGSGRAEGLGARTANITLPAKLLPPDGVYLVRGAVEEDKPVPGLANLGYSPTFGGTERRLEVHLLGEDRMIYGRSMRVFFEDRLRDEKTFPTPEALASQIADDLKRARRHFRLRK